MLRKKINLIGQKFGKGIVIKDTGKIIEIGKQKYKKSYQIWELKCECGNNYETSTRYLINNLTKSCGCIRRKNLIGKRFGKGIVTNFFGNKFRGNSSRRSCVVWELKCDCGNTYHAISEFLSNGSVKSCGCQRKTLNRTPCGSTTLHRYLKNFRGNSQRTKIFFTLQENDLKTLIEKQNYKCALSGINISFEENTASLDRINNDIGYMLENVQWVHRTINYMKNVLPQNTFIEFCKAVARNFPN
jgi:hypothetical protein